MKEQRRIAISLPPQTLAGKPGVIIKPGATLGLQVDLPPAPFPVRRRLRVVGETDVFWRWRCERGMPQLFRDISDALDTGRAMGEKYSLTLAGNGETWPRCAYMRISARGLVRQLAFAAMVCAEELEIAPGGELVIELGIYGERNWRHPDDVFDPPDSTVTLRIPAGTYDWQEISAPVILPEDAVTLLVRVGGTAFSGRTWVGSPRLFPPGGETVIPPFVPANRHEFWHHLVWLGENLSRFEWPEFTIAVNGHVSASGRFFNAIVRHPDFEVALPDLAPGPHRIDLTLNGDYATALPFVVQHVELIEESARPVEIVACPEYVQEGKPFGVLVEINGPASCEQGARTARQAPSTASMPANESGAFPAVGRLEAVKLDAGPARAAPRYEFQVAGVSCVVTPTRVVRSDVDDVILSTGDNLYVPQDVEAILRFLMWYTENRIGNGICFRPVYRWSGTREANPEVWKTIVPLLEGLGMRYHLMVDGRELPGLFANPSDDMLAGPNYLGRQAHERDGAYLYWGISRHDSLYADIHLRGLHAGGIYMTARPTVRRAGQSLWHYDAHYAADMRQAAEYFVANLAAERGGARRHTGPSAQFHYFYRAGYEWLGAEQMYGPEEVILSALRGAARAVGKRDYGAHLAVQWGSGPHDTQAHADRYFLSLATSYLHGVTQINMEEGLWRMEADYAPQDRFSHACTMHRETHTKFRRFLETHPRRGVMRTPIAILKGRYCGWQCFTRGVWGSEREDFRFGPPEESFELLKVFYPRSILNAIYRRPCRDDQPQGWYTGTPFGPVDILPLADRSRIDGYLAIAFLGWNTFQEDDFTHLVDYVEKGGTLLLARPHLSTHVTRRQPSALPLVSPALERLLGRVPQGGQRIERQVGRGRVIYYPHDNYPSDAALRDAYVAELAALGEAAVASESRRGWIKGNEDVSFAVYDWAGETMRTIYLLNIDGWSGKPAATAEFLFGDSTFKVEVPAGTIRVITVGERTAVMPEGMDADVADIAETPSGARLTVQSDAGTILRCFTRDGSVSQRVTVKAGGIQDVIA